eukprot:TRINITY_DN5937_c0_g1_i1.p1 TRINITY_DN5937_c0_g1~~TRINITY_DN5937_c0_g1_i1.p1  ORF type:complete len:415 (-),score=70.62 TRINITY_DN5937_c0_g1_i1:78-1322(-)
MKRVVVVLFELWLLKMPFGSKLASRQESWSSGVIPVAHLPTQSSPAHEIGDSQTLASDPLDAQGLEMEKVEDFYPCFRKGHFMPTDQDVCGRTSTKPTSVRMVKKSFAKIPKASLDACPPKTAVLLTGLMRDWEAHVESLEKSTLEPCNTDLFVATDTLPSPLKERFGTRLKSYVEAQCDVTSFHQVWNATDAPFTPPWCQWLHLSRAWNVMTDYEDKHAFKYDVVFRQRSDMVIQPPAYMTFVGWNEADKVHMMTDMLFWAKRPAFEKVAALFPNLHKYFVVKYPDPWTRELNAVRLLDSLNRDPFFNAQDTSEGWGLYQKIKTLPYPDMGLQGAVQNLQAAVNQGATVVVGTRLHCGDFCNPGDYPPKWFVTEKDTLQWIINQDLTICDLGASAHLIKAKQHVATRKLAKDC